MFEPQFNRVEKIKIISSTVMAACGLIPGRYTFNDHLLVFFVCRIGKRLLLICNIYYTIRSGYRGGE